MAATKRIMPKPRTFQVMEMITAQLDSPASTPSQRIGVVDHPDVLRNLLINP